MDRLARKARNKELGAIHGTARKLGMGEFQRRSLQYEVTGKESCLEMNETERRAVIDELKRAKVQPRPVEVVTDEEALEILGLL